MLKQRIDELVKEHNETESNECNSNEIIFLLDKIIKELMKSKDLIEQTVTASWLMKTLTSLVSSENKEIRIRIQPLLTIMIELYFSSN